MKDKKPEQQTKESKPRTNERWSLFKNRGKFGDFYSLKKGDLRISINAELLLDLIERANRYFENEAKKDNKAEG